MIPHLQLFSIFLLLCVGAISSAQPLREIEFSVYGQYPVRGIEYTPISEAAIATGAKADPPVSIKTHSLTRMGPHIFKGGDQITFQDASSKEQVAQVHLTAESDKWLLIFVKNPSYKEDPSNNSKYLIYAFDDSPRNLPKNGLVFLNISGKELDGLLENKRVKLSAGESGRYRVQESLPINLWSRDFSGEKLLPALIKTYHFNPDHRYLMIFFPPVLRGSVDLDVRFLSEAVE
jgi:hypothetical protein